MRHGRVALSSLLLSVVLAGVARAQEPGVQTKQAPATTLTLPTLTAEQSWGRAAYNLNYFLAAMIRQGAAQGQKPLQVGIAMGEIAAESWTIPAGADPALVFAQGMAANFQVWPGSSPTVVEAKAGAVTLRYNPAYYRKQFADNQMPSGVSAADFDTFFQGLMKGLGAQLGLNVTVAPDGDQFLVTIKQAPAPKL